MLFDPAECGPSSKTNGIGCSARMTPPWGVLVRSLEIPDFQASQP